MAEIYLLNITGKDRTGLVARFNGVLAEHGANVLDIGQAVIHDYISLGLLVELPDERQSSPMLKDLLFAGHDLGLDVRFRPTTLDDYEEWVQEGGKERRVITLLGRRLAADDIARVAAVCADEGLNIDVITRLSGRPSLRNPARHPKACVEMTVRGPLADDKGMRDRLWRIADETGIDIAFHADDIYRRNRRLVAFDMDSTLIQCEVIDELARRAGVGAEVAAITEAAMRGGLDFRESLVRRVALLAGLDESVLKEVADNLPLSEGAERVAGTLKRLGYKLAILSGGFDYFGRRLQKLLGFDYMFANQLEIADGKLTGALEGEIIDGQRKADLLALLAAGENLSLEQTIAVGDGANDLPMLGAAGLGVAFHAKPIVREQAARTITDVGLDGLLYLMGIREREIVAG
jgi:phosphoserine phosphatase